MSKPQMTLASLSTPSCVLQKRSEYEVISLMIHLITSWSKILNLLGFTFYLRFTNGCIIFLADPLFQIIDSIQELNSFIKDTNLFLRKIKSLGQVPEEAILCIIDVVGIYPNMPHEKVLASLTRFLDARTQKNETTETLVDLIEIALKNIFQINEKTLKQLRGTNWY